MEFQLTPEQEEIRKQVRALCSRFPDEYWRERDESGEFAWDFYQAVADAGYLGITIPQEYGGNGLHDQGRRWGRHPSLLVGAPRDLWSGAADQIRHRRGQAQIPEQSADGRDSRLVRRH